MMLAMPDASTVLPSHVLAFDFGTKRIGVASGVAFSGLGSPLPPLPARDGIPDWSQLDRLVAMYSPQALLVGNPLNMDETPSVFGQRALKFARRLAARFPAIPVYQQDERLTTRAAKSLLADLQAEGRHASASVDSTAACLLVSAWYEAPHFQRV